MINIKNSRNNRLFINTNLGAPQIEAFTSSFTSNPTVSVPITTISIPPEEEEGS